MFTFEQSLILNDILTEGMDKTSFMMALFDIYESEDDITVRSIIESLVMKIDPLSIKEFKELSKKVPFEYHIVKEDLL